MDLQLAGKRAIVTGGSRGIGRAIAGSLVAEGCDVAIAARTSLVLEQTAAAIRATTDRTVLPLVVDTGDDNSVRSMVKAATDAFGGVDILVNSAAKPGGQAAPPRFHEVTGALFWDDMNVKVLGYLRCAQAVAPGMIDQGWGRIINISGLAARSTGSTLGSMRNVAVAAMTKNLAEELGPRGITVTVVHPALTRTEATPAAIARLASARGMTPDEVEQTLADNNIRRVVGADEVADVVTFLASPRAGCITGDAIACGGGQAGSIHY
jgi:NAD(P)-dependent dehydrogenase (short-subunit alcohol dehydrogenase family)